MTFKEAFTQSIDITSIDGDRLNFMYGLEPVKETSRSIYCVSPLYGDSVRIEKATTRLYKNGKQIADKCEYSKSCL